MTPTTLKSAITKSTPFRIVLAALVLTGALTTEASAVSLRVKMACASDYYSFCSQHPVGTTAVRVCMRAHGSQLSKGCVNALVTAGEVSKAEVNRKVAARAARAANKRTASVD